MSIDTASLKVLLEVLQWAGCLTALLGSLSLALARPWARWGWASFFLSNCCWIASALLSSNHAMLVMQLGFVVTSGIGLWKNFGQSQRRPSGLSSSD